MAASEEAASVKVVMIAAQSRSPRYDAAWSDEWSATSSAAQSPGASRRGGSDGSGSREQGALVTEDRNLVKWMEVAERRGAVEAQAGR